MGDKVGVFKIYKDNKMIAEIKAVAAENVSRKGLFDYANEIAQ